MLSKRLKSIVDNVKVGTCKILDVGTDHAFVPIYLVKNNICEYAIASDINEAPVNIAKDNIIAYNQQDKIEVRHGAGLSVISKDDGVNAFIIAGMGGILIKQILMDNIDIVESCGYFILQPMQDIGILRGFLIQNGFYIYNEELVEDMGKIYQIISVTNNEINVQHIDNYILQIVEDLDYMIGYHIIKNKDVLLNKLVDKEIARYNTICNNISKSNKPQNIAELDRNRNILKNLQKIKELMLID